MSSYSDVVDGVLADLTGEVTALVGATVHRYAQLGAESFVVDDAKHLGCWLAPENAEAAEPFTTQSHNLLQAYKLVYWEPADLSEVARTEEDAAARLLELADAVKARFYRLAFVVQAGSWQVWYGTLDNWGNVGGSRFLEWTFTAKVAQDFS